ncbi:MAG: hypothetical protein QXI39_09930 [Candidatus Bathyarchaeia archaeon]
MKHANDFLEDRGFKSHVGVHSIAIIGGIARCYFDKNDGIERHKDVDIDIYFAPILDGLDRSLLARINTQCKPAVIYYEGKRVEISRIALRHPRSNDFIEDVRAHGRAHKSIRWKGDSSKGIRGRLGNPIVFIYPEIRPLEKL